MQAYLMYKLQSFNDHKDSLNNYCIGGKKNSLQIKCTRDEMIELHKDGVGARRLTELYEVEYKNNFLLVAKMMKFCNPISLEANQHLKLF